MNVKFVKYFSIKFLDMVLSELCGNTAVFAKSMAMLGNSEDHTALSRALSQLAEVEDKMEQLHQEQASSDFFIFAEMLADYIRLLGAVRVRIHYFAHLLSKLLNYNG